MEVLRRFLKLIAFLYLLGKWLGLTAWLVVFASTIWAEGFLVLLIPLGFYLILSLVIPLIILSVFEWIVFGKFTWSYRAFDFSLLPKVQAEEKREIEKSIDRDLLVVPILDSDTVIGVLILICGAIVLYLVFG